jgi:hypothetical protein
VAAGSAYNNKPATPMTIWVTNAGYRPGQKLSAGWRLTITRRLTASGFMAGFVGTMQAENEENESGQGPACIPCRKRKQKCSRGEPCESCANGNLNCLYADFKKRGTKPGYVESLAQRVDQLEAIVLGQSMLLSSASVQKEGTMADRLKSLAGYLISVQKDDTVASEPRPTKKHKTMEDPDNSNLPSPEMLSHLCNIYFTEIHPWIPILHQRTFIPTIHNRNRSTILLQAIAAVTLKFANMPKDEQRHYYKIYREAVLLAAMDRFSIETLQASIIIAFDTIGSGKGPRSWSIVSSATRIVEHLGLAAEEEDIERDNLLNRIGFLSHSKTIVEEESRRRIFWSIFLMDRFCSVTTGWNTSLTSKDVKRRLPMEGCLFRDSIKKQTRYFNIEERDIDPSNSGDALGGYSYLVEATECLTRIVNFLLHEKVSFHSKEAFKQWFSSFQTLDTLLVRWKTFLPDRWQVARVDVWGGMDENLTLAHVTHNTSVLLLHQNLAYPPPELKVGMPNRQSIQTCLTAASEIATITTKFLLHVKRIVAPQFAFCVFIAARTLLTHYIHCGADPDHQFESLLASLKEMSNRWQSNGFEKENLASQFAARLEVARNSNSPINTRLAVFDDEQETQTHLSLASPPFAAGSLTAILDQDIKTDRSDGRVPLNAVVDNDFNFDFISEMPNVNDMDYVFSWADDG